MIEPTYFANSADKRYAVQHTSEDNGAQTNNLALYQLLLIEEITLFLDHPYASQKKVDFSSHLHSMVEIQLNLDHNAYTDCAIQMHLLHQSGAYYVNPAFKSVKAKIKNILINNIIVFIYHKYFFINNQNGV